MAQLSKNAAIFDTSNKSHFNLCYYMYMQHEGDSRFCDNLYTCFRDLIATKIQCTHWWRWWKIFCSIKKALPGLLIKNMKDHTTLSYIVVFIVFVLKTNFLWFPFLAAGKSNYQQNTIFYSKKRGG